MPYFMLQNRVYQLTVIKNALPYTDKPSVSAGTLYHTLIPDTGTVLEQATTSCKTYR